MTHTYLTEAQVWSLKPAKFAATSSIYPLSPSSSRKSEGVRDYHHFLGCSHVYTPSRRHLSYSHSRSDPGVPARGDMCTVCWSALVFDHRGKRLQNKPRPAKRRNGAFDRRDTVEMLKQEGAGVLERRKIRGEDFESQNGRGLMMGKCEFFFNGHDTRRLLEGSKKTGNEDGEEEKIGRSGPGEFWGVMVEISRVEPRWRGINVERALKRAGMVEDELCEMDHENGHRNRMNREHEKGDMEEEDEDGGMDHGGEE